MDNHNTDVRNGERFKFGENWLSFLNSINEQRIIVAEEALKNMLSVKHLKNKKFIDVGSGSGLSSLAARRLGATVHSFDYDPQSVACTQELKNRYFAKDDAWIIEKGSVLDTEFISKLGQHDVVYSWGVLHHTGNMWSGLENVIQLVGIKGVLFIAIYNNEGFYSNLWKKIKKTYNSGMVGRYTVKVLFYPWFALRLLIAGLINYHNPFKFFFEYKNRRGMSIVHDWDDWLGGYPFEVAKPEELFHFYHTKGFELVNMKTTNRLGCNELIFIKRV